MNTTDRPPRAAIRFSIGDDLRFVSHRDVVRLLERALVRARIAVRYSSGFNPHMRLWVPLPRPVGVAGEDELLIIELKAAVAPGRIREALRAQIPAGMLLRGVETLATRATPRPVEAEYRLPVTNGTRAPLAVAVARLLSHEIVDVHRQDPGDAEPRTINIRPLIGALEVGPGELRFRVRLTPRGSVRPRELLAALGLAPEDHVHRLRRTAVAWVWPSKALPTQGPADEGAIH